MMKDKKIKLGQVETRQMLDTFYYRGDGLVSKAEMLCILKNYEGENPIKYD